MNGKSRPARQLRIVGGQLRGRKFRFPDNPAIRPTPDRVRETLFNWLAPVIYDARCLDLFAGSGALGFEACSRGAREVIAVEKDPALVRFLNETAHQFRLDHYTARQTPAERFLDTHTQPFDLVFVDPPFHQNLAQPVCDALEQHQLLTDNARIYLETEPGLTFQPPARWRLLKTLNAGQVCCRLFAVDD